MTSPPTIPREGVLAYWRRVFRFALQKGLPSTPADVPVWGLTVPYLQWRVPFRYDGYTFEELYAGRVSPLMRAIMPLRLLYLAFLFLWPLVAAWRAIKRGRGAALYWRGALWKPELSLLHASSTYTPEEWAWTRPDYALCMYCAWEYHHNHPEYLRLEDKHFFLQEARRVGLPVPPTFTREEAIARGGEFIVKDPDRDLGFGIELMDAEELAELEDADTLIIQPRLRNHPSLIEVFSDEAPLSTLRVTTMLDPDRGEPVIVRCAIRIGHAGDVADNTAQGGIWSRIDLETGEIQAGVTKKSFGLWRQGKPVRYGAHPDTGHRFEGMKVPWWEEGRRLALEAHRKLAPEAATLGWDVALAEGGPVLLEVNVWTVVYDYDPQTDAFTPSCRLILQRLHAGRIPTEV